jgi:hypothetical protein
MKNKLLLTTALVGVAFAIPAMAAEEWDGKTSYLIPQGEALVLEENSLVENITNNADGIGGALSTSKPKNGVENPGTLIVKSGTVFKNNTAKYDGGAIANFGVLDIDGATFEANKSQTEKTDSQPVGGGAISLGIDSKTTIKNTKFVNNETGFNGGAIGTRRTINNGDITNGSHENHSLIISDSAFIGNKATGTTTDRADNKLQGGNGGAIANTFNNTQISNTVFEKNEAINGGAVYNQSLFNTNNQTQENDKGGDIKFADVTFDGNKASTNGGAIFNDANTNTELSGTVVFSGNEAGNAGGAIFVADASSSMEIASGAVFKSNSAKLGGAIYNKGNLGTLDGVTFEDNTAKTNGGAILNSNGGKIASITNSIFKNNTSTNGGGAAIYNKGGEIAEISNTVFEGNIAEKGNGGAIFNGGTTAANITLDNVQFIGNQAANGSGGAISTSGVVNIANATFENNSASTGGGAINVDGTVKLSGENTFSGNKVGDKLNDINLNQNNGLAKVDVSGTLTLDGGISGEGTTSFADNTKLNITENTTFGEDVAITIGENTELGLIVDSGEESAEFDTSKLLGENGFTLADNALYNAIVGDDGKVTMEQKSADEAAASLGLSGSQAEAVLGAISGGSSDNANFNSFREALNQHLQSADKAQVSNGTGAADLLTADANPVIRSVETGIHNMVFSAVSDELNGTSAAMAEGKSSGDAFKQVKAWIRALFSHSDHESTSKASGFDTNSDGVAMGIDKQLDNRTKVGLGYAYSSTDISSGIRDTDVDTHTAFVYGQYKPANWYINTVVAYNWSVYSEKKAALGFNANADYDVESWAVQSLYGYEMQLNGYDVTPEAGLRYAHISQDGYTDALGTSVAANDSDILTAIVGAKVAKDYALDSDTIIRPELRAAVTYDLVDDANNSNVVLANGVAYRVNGEKLNRLGFELGAKVATDVSDNWEISLAYEGGFREDYQNHTGMLNAKYKF